MPNLANDLARCYGTEDTLCITCSRRIQIQRDNEQMKSVRYSVWFSYMQAQPINGKCDAYIRDSDAN